MEQYYIDIADIRIVLTIFDDGTIYPLTIVTDRFGGAYTGGKYLAFPLDSYSKLVTDNFEEDGAILIDKESPLLPQRIYGVGDTPNEALDDLKKLAREGGYYKPPFEYFKISENQNNMDNQNQNIIQGPCTSSRRYLANLGIGNTWLFTPGLPPSKYKETR